MKFLYIVIVSVFFTSCSKESKKWQFQKNITLENVHPIGIAILDGKIWLSDGDGNRLVEIDEEGKTTQQIPDLERPMHIATSDQSLLIPEYGKDQITRILNLKKNALAHLPKLDAPAGIDKNGSEIAIADFYNNTVHYYNGKNWIKIGEKGTENGKLNYPTDVQFFNNQLFVADAYNHRVQVFNKSGKSVKVLAENLGINAATGIFVTGKQIFITDFENSRILIISHENELIQELNTKINKPTDMLIYNAKLYVTNYKSGSLSVFE